MTTDDSPSPLPDVTALPARSEVFGQDRARFWGPILGPLPGDTFAFRFRWPPDIRRGRLWGFMALFCAGLAAGGFKHGSLGLQFFGVGGAALAVGLGLLSVLTGKSWLILTPDRLHVFNHVLIFAERYQMDRGEIGEVRLTYQSRPGMRRATESLLTTDMAWGIGLASREHSEGYPIEIRAGSRGAVEAVFLGRVISGWSGAPFVFPERARFADADPLPPDAPASGMNQVDETVKG